MAPTTHSANIEAKQLQPQTGIAETELRPQFLVLNEGRRIAYLRREAGLEARPGLVWLGGFMSHMRSTKAEFLDECAAHRGRAYLRFDYSGHGESEGSFEQATIGAWLEESLAVIRTQSCGPQILVGSSMGAWLALLAAHCFAESGELDRLAGLVLLAPAVDMTEKLIFEKLPPASRATLETEGVCLLPTAHSDSPYRITRRLIEEGRRHQLLETVIRTHCPVHIVHGMQDEDVPWQHSVRLVEHLAGDPVLLSLVKDGDHRLSRPSDLGLVAQAIETVIS
jgi:pimeloyl-ACP methyl ester carboxylesterase